MTVSELTSAIRGALEARFSSVWIEGEISNFKAHSSGHWYFTLKDEGAQLRAKCFRSANTRIRFRPSDGLHVRARGRLSVYEARGDYELIVEARPAGRRRLADSIRAASRPTAGRRSLCKSAEAFSASFSQASWNSHFAYRRCHSRHHQCHFTSHANSSCVFHLHACRAKEPAPVLHMRSN